MHNQHTEALESAELALDNLLSDRVLSRQRRSAELAAEALRAITKGKLIWHTLLLVAALEAAASSRERLHGAARASGYRHNAGALREQIRADYESGMLPLSRAHGGSDADEQAKTQDRSRSGDVLMDAVSTGIEVRGGRSRRPAISFEQLLADVRRRCLSTPPGGAKGGGGGGESFPRVDWVAVPEALRARRVNRWRSAAEISGGVEGGWAGAALWLLPPRARGGGGGPGGGGAPQPAAASPREACLAAAAQPLERQRRWRRPAAAADCGRRGGSTPVLRRWPERAGRGARVSEAVPDGGAVSDLCACIGSPCLRQSVHGAPIGGSARRAPRRRV
jgi:hypothetical protein